MSYAARMPEAWIIDGVRSPRGRGKDTGSLHDIHPQELLAAGAQRARRPGRRRPRCGRGRDHRQQQQRRRPRQRHRPHVTARGRLARHHARLHREPLLRLRAAGGEPRGDGSGGGAHGSRRRWRCRVDVASATRERSGRPHRGQRAPAARVHPLVPQGISADLIATLEQFSAKTATRSRSRASGAPRSRRPKVVSTAA